MNDEMTTATSADRGPGFFAGVGIGFALAVMIGLAVAAFATLGPEESPAAEPVDTALLAAQGERAAATYGCAACHTVDGTPRIGPSWLGVAGSERTLSDGTVVVADSAYLRNSILDPSSQLVEGYDDAMPKGLGDLISSEDLEALVAYMESLGS